MKTCQKLSFICYAIAALLLAALGLIYLLRTQFMPYHAVALGREWIDLEPATKVLILAFMRLAGGAWLATSVAIFVILLKPFREGFLWAQWAVPAIGLIAISSSLHATLYVANNTPATPPWATAALGVLLLILGFVLFLIPALQRRETEI